MFFMPLDQMVEVEQSKFAAHTNTWPKDYPYVGAALAAIDSGDPHGGAIHLSNLARLNADLHRLRVSAPDAFVHYVDAWRNLVRNFPKTAQASAANIRGWRVEVLTAAELGAAGIPFSIGDPNPRKHQGRPDLLVQHGGAQLVIECGSVEPDGDGDLAERVYNAAWGKAFDKQTKRLREYVGPDALLVLDVTCPAAHYAADAEGTADFKVFSESLARAINRRKQRHGVDWGAILFHYLGIYAERRHPKAYDLRRNSPAWATSTRGSSAVVTRASEPLEIVNRSFFALVRHRPSAQLDSLITTCFPMARGQVTTHLEHLPWSIVY